VRSVTGIRNPAHIPDAPEDLAVSFARLVVLDVEGLLTVSRFEPLALAVRPKCTGELLA
jgi:hypothetical protein